MMENRGFFALTLLVFAFSCKPNEVEIPSGSRAVIPCYLPIEIDPSSGNLCLTDTCTTYAAIWKEIWLEKNSVTEDFFQHHITPYNSNLVHSYNGLLFQVCYRINSGWAITTACDQFIIQVPGSKTLRSKEQIASSISFGTPDADLTKVLDRDIVFPVQDSAKAILTRRADVKQLCNFRVFIDEATGHLMLQGNAQFTFRSNSCVFATLDLTGGSATTYESACFLD